MAELFRVKVIGLLRNQFEFSVDAALIGADRWGSTPKWSAREGADRATICTPQDTLASDNVREIVYQFLDLC